MGQADLSSNSLISHSDVFADIINAIVYEGRQVLDAQNLKPYYLNKSVHKNSNMLKGLYRDNCMEDMRSGIRYALWGIENQNGIDRAIPFRIMGYDFSTYDRQIGEFTAKNKTGNKAITQTLLPEQKLTPVITLVLYWGDDEMPKSIFDMLNMPDEKNIRKYIQNYKLNVISLKKLTKKQTDRFKSDFKYIAKFLCREYNKDERMDMLKSSGRMLIHPKDTLYTLTAITGDSKYLQIGDDCKEEFKVCEVADAFVQIGVEQGREQEREHGIMAMVTSARKLGADDNFILAQLAESYKLNNEQAMAYMEKY